MNKFGRNDPCPCGSGKKYKKCCLPLDPDQRPHSPPGGKPFLAELRPEVDKAVDRALERLEHGEGERVQPKIAELLEAHPEYHMTNYAMGVYHAIVTKNPAAAIPFFEKAVSILPQFADAQFNLGMAARQLFDIPKALEAFRAAERYSQDDRISESAREQLQWMEKILLQSTPLPSLDAYVANARLFDSALQCLNDRRFAEAVELFNRVLSENPKHVQTHGNLGLAYAGLGRRADALACFDRALELDGAYEPAILNRRVIEEKMRDGQPFIPDGVREVEYYADCLRAVRGRE